MIGQILEQVFLTDQLPFSVPNSQYLPSLTKIWLDRSQSLSLDAILSIARLTRQSVHHKVGVRDILHVL